MQFFKNGLIALASMILCLGLLEGGLESGGSEYSKLLFRPDSARGFGFRPGLEGWFKEEGQNYARINSRGYRDRERDLQRPADTVRVALLGDSTVAGLQVSLEETFASVAEKELGKCLRSGVRKIEVLNFGVNNYSLAQNQITLRDDVWKYDPQVVMVAVSLTNALLNSTRACTISGSDYPYYAYQNGRLQPDEVTRAQKPMTASQIDHETRLIDLENRSQLFLLAKQAMRKLDSWKTTATRMTGKHFPSNYAKVWPFVPPSNPAMAEAWRVSEGTLKLMKEDADAHHAEFWVVTLDVPNQVHPDPQVREAWRREIGAETLYYPDTRLANWARSEGAKAVMLAPDMGEYATRQKVFLHGFANTAPNAGHLNPAGHRIAGELIAKALCVGSAQFQAVNSYPALR